MRAKENSWLSCSWTNASSWPLRQRVSVIAVTCNRSFAAGTGNQAESLLLKQLSCARFEMRTSSISNLCCHFCCLCGTQLVFRALLSVSCNLAMYKTGNRTQLRLQ